MKKLIKLSIIFGAILIFSGCTAATFHTIQTPKPVQSKIEVVIPKDKSNKTVWIENRDSTLHDKIDIVYKKIAETFYTAAIYGKQNGYSYFALTSEKMNNLNGYPINTFDNVIKYCRFEKKIGKKYRKPNPVCWDEGNGGIFDLFSVNLQVQYYKKPISGLFLYDIEEVIKQTEKYL